MRYRQILTLMLGMLVGGAAGAGAVYLFVRPNAATEGPEPSTQARLPLFKLGPQTPELAEGLRVLERIAGTWDAEMTPLSSDGTPVGKAQRAVIIDEWAVNKRFLLSRNRDEDGTEGLILRTYDVEKKVYPTWYFDWRGRGYPAIGRWDEKTATMTTERKTPEGDTLVTTLSRSADPNTFQMNFKGMNERGTLMSHFQGKLTRLMK
ncbi:MAG: hypothetical protein U0793_07530 [Gemmataceae bacterium]